MLAGNDGTIAAGRGRRARRWAIGPLLLTLGTLAWAAPAAAAAEPAPQPNVITITTDDQTLAQMNEETMPFASRLFANGGSSFDNAVVVSPSCCPSRAAYQSGQYPHNNGIFANKPGYPELVGKRNTLPVWLQRAGYRTAHVGKYLHQYGAFASGWGKPAPGWDTWYTLAGTFRYYEYRIGKNGGSKLYGSRPRDYLTRRLNAKAVSFVERSAAKDAPFYLQLDQLAPHAETSATPGRCTEAAQPDPEDLELFVDAPLPQDHLDPGERSYNEQDVSDKSPVLAARRELSDFVLGKVATRYRCQLAALAGVDRGIQEIYRALRRSGELGNTAIFLTSDNGFFHAEHRLPNNKGYPYEEGIRVPLLARVPRSVAPNSPSTVSEPVANIDITASVLELAGAEPCNASGCRRLDGRSLVGLLNGESGSWPTERALLVEQVREGVFCEAYAAAWMPTDLYVEYPTQLAASDPCAIETEHYEMTSDPLQLENLFPAPSAGLAKSQRQLQRRLGRLRRCSGVAERDEQLPGVPYCE
jgi:arylsulfatase A-like enzyme